MVRIVIVAEVRLYREGLAEALGRRPTLEVLESVANPRDAVGAVSNLQPDVVLLDMAARGSFSLVSEIKTVAANSRVVALAAEEADAMPCAEAGVAGYVSRDGSLEDLVNAIEMAGRGEMLCTPQMAGTMIRRIAWLAAGGHGAPDGGELTSREKEILRLIDRGCSNKEIAKSLGIEVATVKNHVHNLLAKLHVHRRGQAAAQVRPRHLQRPPAREFST